MTVPDREKKPDVRDLLELIAKLRNFIVENTDYIPMVVIEADLTLAQFKEE